MGMHVKKPWTMAEVKKLKEHFCASSKEELLRLFPQRTYHAIRAQAQRLGLPKDNEA